MKLRIAESQLMTNLGLAPDPCPQQLGAGGYQPFQLQFSPEGQRWLNGILNLDTPQRSFVRGT
jgi:hypothetical protein